MSDAIAAFWLWVSDAVLADSVLETVSTGQVGFGQILGRMDQLTVGIDKRRNIEGIFIDG